MSRGIFDYFGVFHWFARIGLPMTRCCLGESARLARGVRQPDRVGVVMQLV